MDTNLKTRAGTTVILLYWIMLYVLLTTNVGSRMFQEQVPNHCLQENIIFSFYIAGSCIEKKISTYLSTYYLLQSSWIKYTVIFFYSIAKNTFQN